MSKKNNKIYWPSKFWMKNNVSDIINELIDPNDVDIQSIQFHDSLSPLIWESNDVMKSDVRKTLLKNAKEFIEFSDIENLKFSDIILTGSLANYNYNENSDLDVHVILDFNQVSENNNFVSDYFKMKKQLWADMLPIQVKGFDVEIYFQDNDEAHHSSGVYSLMKNKWVRKPINKIINIDTFNIKTKSAALMNAIDDLNNNKNDDDILKKQEALKTKIKKYRQAGLDSAGEYSTENLVFKVLRNTGYMKKLIDLKNDQLTKELSLDEYLNTNS